MVVSIHQVHAFREFLTRARSAIDRKAVNRQTSQLVAFRQFIHRATSLICGDLPKVLAALQPVTRAIDRWLLPSEYDLLTIARVTWDEDAYTNLLGWWLHPATHPVSAVRRQQVFLNCLGIEKSRRITHATTPLLRIFTDDGYPDLVLQYTDFTLVVETKTGTLEHAAPSGAHQTIAYPEAVRRKLAFADDFPIHIAYLTIDRHLPANAAAIPISFFDCAVAIASAFTPDDFDTNLCVLIKAWLTHVFLAASLPGVDVPRFLQALKSGPSSMLDDRAALQHLRTITALASTERGIDHARLQGIQ